MRYLGLLVILSAVIPVSAWAAAEIDIIFPLDGEASFTDSFYDARGGGRLHYATDIMAEKMTPVLAVADGRIDFAPMDEPVYGFMLTLEGDDGYTYNYVHLNNDTPGTDDGNGGPEYAYAAGIEQGVRVEQGDHIAYVGDSGNAEDVGSHLHFEIYDGDTPINPYEYLLDAYGSVSTDSVTYDFDPASETARATTINDDLAIPAAEGSVHCESDTLIRTEENSAVYYCGRDGGRYLFQNERSYFSWYGDFEDVELITAEEMASIPLSGTVTYRPGVNLVKLLSVPKVYAVGENGTLRWIPSEEIAVALYGEDWASLVHDLPDGFFPAYTIGETITRSD